MTPYANIVVAVDFTAVGDAAAMRGADLASRFGARLTLLHVIEHFPEDIPVDEVVPEDVDPETAYLQRAEHKLSALAKRIGVPQAERVALTSRAAARQALPRAVAERSADLLVLGAETHHVLGATTPGVLAAAGCDVLVVQGQAKG